MSNTLYPITTHVTPNQSDVIFYEVRKSETSDYQRFKKGQFNYCDPHPDCNKYPDYELVYVSPEGENKERRFYYAAKRKEQYKYNFQYNGLNAGGGPKFKAYNRVYFVKRGEWEYDSLAPGDPDPDKTDDIKTKFPQDEFVFTGETMRRTGEKELDACYVVMIRTFSNLCVLEGTRWDAELEEMVDYTTEIKPSKDVVTPTGLNANGEFTEVKPLNCDWSQCITDVAIDPNKTKTYWTYTNMSLPAVLDSVEFMTWNKLNGERFIVPRPVWLRRAQRKPVLTKIERSYSSTAVDLSAITPKPVSMQPNSISYRCPSFTVSIPACLHKDETFVCNYGNSNPIWNFTTGSDRTYPATELSDGTPATDWPTEMLIEVAQRPYKGGYIIDRITVYPTA